MSTNTLLPTAFRTTFCNAAMPQTALTAGHVCLAGEDSGWIGTLAEKHPYRLSIWPISFEPQPLPQEPIRLRPMHRWGIVLAGGDGVRMREFTQSTWGSDRPKQFCPLLGNGTLLEQTRERAERSIAPEHIVYSVTRAHERFYLPSLEQRASRRVVQPSNKGTAPAILSSLIHISRLDPNATVAILPCDHYYFPESGFTEALESAFNIAEESPRSVLITGIDPKRPEVEYGWIELGATVGSHPGVYQVAAFREKPALPLAESLLRTGSLWNTFVMVGHVCTFLDMAWTSSPRLLQALESSQIASNRDGEIQIPASVYERLASADFSREILVPCTNRLLALRLRNVEWADIGNPERLRQAVLHNQNASAVEDRPATPLQAFRAAAN